MSKHDTHFFIIFNVVLGMLVVFALLIFAFARHVGYKHQFTTMQTDPMVVQAIEGRTGIPARVAVAGVDNSALVIRPVVANAGVVPAMAMPTDATEVYEVACKACHGMAGVPVANEWPVLAGQQAAYLQKQLAAFKSGERFGSLMQMAVGQLGEAEFAALAAYYSQLAP